MTHEPILIVDDTPMNLRLLVAVLEGAGYNVQCATTAEEALAVLSAARPRLMLLDLQLPGVDGLSLTRRLREDPQHSELIIIAVTSYAMKGDREKALAVGVDDYVTKPVDTRSLPRLVQQHLDTGRRNKS